MSVWVEGSLVFSESGHISDKFRWEAVEEGMGRASDGESGGVAVIILE